MRAANSKGLALAVLLAVFLQAGCAGGKLVQVRPDAQGQVRPPSKFEQALAVNLLLAQTNNSLADGMIAAHAGGLAPRDVTATVLQTCRKVADLDDALTRILEKGEAAAKADAATIKVYVDGILTELSSTVVLNGMAIKNPKSQQTFMEDAAVVRAFAGSLLTLLQQAGVLP